MCGQLQQELAANNEAAMGIMAMTLALMCLTMGAGCLLWMLLLHFEEIHAAEEHEMSHSKRRALVFLTLAGLTIVGALGVLALEIQQLFTPAFS